jgi:hypothetical protein
LAELYRQLDAAVAELAPVCRISGRCCRFREYGHTLFVSTLEFDYLIDRASRPVRQLDDGETCPWQDAQGRCTAREARPLGCRVYFCDAAYEHAAPELSERFIARLKKVTDSHGLLWDYAPIHRHLHERAESIRFPEILGASDPS